ncbi:phage antirepressor [Melissococcus plutonius]|uniref:phage antirepressor n=4 Tax=Melissococcus plutonius TaxID=33970 RepID=UPI0021E54FBB|nr:phage antirepressor [Melissococcus plutonius]MCV2528117.1 phage antirepressor [Melissococcus plutonius]
MNTPQIFNFEQDEVRTVLINDEPYFVGRDVANILGYTNTAKAIKDHVDDEDKLTERIVMSGQNREVNIINESGLYSLILSSKMPNAKKFKRWVTSKVLPSIRKHGMYATDDLINNPDLLIKVATELKQEKAKRIAVEKQNDKLKPKAIFADSVSASHTSILVGELAKLLKQNGLDMGQNKLFTWLRDHGYLIRRKGTDYNMPTQRSMEQGLFEIKETAINRSNGTVSISKTPKVTGKGQVYFVNKFCREIA